MLEKSYHERYSRQMSLKGFGEAQAKLQSAKVLVTGAGGLGCPALQYLAAAGVGTIGIVDDDVVSLSNLHRQTLYTTEDVGAFKVEKAALRLKAMNPGVTINPYRIRLKKEVALDIIGLYDLVVDGTDNFASRYMINDACILMGRPLVYGAVSQYQGQVAVFNANSVERIESSTNYRDLFPHPPKDSEVPSCAEAGVLGVLPGIIGTMQAAEAIKIITGIGKPLINRLLIYNLLTNQFYDLNITPSADHNTLPKNEEQFLAMEYEEVCLTESKDVIEIDATQFEALINQPSTIVIDVREKAELPFVSNFKHVQIPMSVFAEQLERIEQSTVVLFCQHGIRSLYAAELVYEAFGSSKQVYSLRGGLVKWAAELGVNI